MVSWQQSIRMSVFVQDQCPCRSTEWEKRPKYHDTYKALWKLYLVENLEVIYLPFTIDESRGSTAFANRLHVKKGNSTPKNSTVLWMKL